MLKRRLRDISRSTEGSTIIEYALVIPIFLLLVMGIVEYSLIMYSQAVLSGAMIDGARQAKTGYNPTGGDQSLSGICTGKTGQAYITCVVQFRVGGLLDPNKLIMSNNSASDLTYALANGTVVLYTVKYPWVIATPFIEHLLPNAGNGTVTLSASILVKDEDPNANANGAPLLSQ